MLPFAVSIKDVSKPGQAQWVLAVDHGELLVAYDDQTLHWHKLEDCRFVRAASPDMPQPVVIVQPPQGLVMPGIGQIGRG